MAIVPYTLEFSAMVTPARMFKAMILEYNVYIPKILPHGIKSIEFVEGDGGAGSIRVTKFLEDGRLKFMKHRIDAVDTEKLVCKYTLIESDAVPEKLDFSFYVVKFEASGDGGCVVKIDIKYHAKAGLAITDEDVKEGLGKVRGLHKATEQYLLLDCCA